MLSNVECKLIPTICKRQYFTNAVVHGVSVTIQCFRKEISPKTHILENLNKKMDSGASPHFFPRLYDTFVAHNYCYIVHENCGKCLADIVLHRLHDAGSIFEILKQLGTAVEFLEKVRVNHNGITMERIFVEKNIKIVDFILATDDPNKFKMGKDLGIFLDFLFRSEIESFLIDYISFLPEKIQIFLMGYCDKDSRDITGFDFVKDCILYRKKLKIRRR